MFNKDNTVLGKRQYALTPSPAEKAEKRYRPDDYTAATESCLRLAPYTNVGGAINYCQRPHKRAAISRRYAF